MQDRNEVDKTMRTRIIFLSAVMLLFVIAAIFEVYGEAAEAANTRIAELETENLAMQQELWRLDELMEQGNRDDFPADAEDGPQELYVEETAASAYYAPAWGYAGEYRIVHYCACEECRCKTQSNPAYYNTELKEGSAKASAAVP